MMFSCLFTAILTMLILKYATSLTRIAQIKFSSRISMSKKLEIRPTLDDVERISKGLAAKRRGTGSRAVPHRLNTAERVEWDLAKKRRYLLLRGSGWRKERGDSPLANIFRQFCDASDIPCVSVARGLSSTTNMDEVVVDFSPLRTKDIKHMASICVGEARQFQSVVDIVDFSDSDKQGWETLDDALESDAIWRIPVFGVSVTFSDRNDSRNFAETIACQLAGGTRAGEAAKAAILVDDVE